MSTLLYPVTNEKAIGLIEFQNTITFVIETKATKAQVKKDVEELFEVKVERVNTMIAPDGRKKAYVKLKKGFKADDVATKLKIV